MSLHTEIATLRLLKQEAVKAVGKGVKVDWNPVWVTLKCLVRICRPKFDQCGEEKEQKKMLANDNENVKN